MDEDEWMQPPRDKILEYVPVGARSLYQEQWMEMAEYIERYPNDEARWFMVLRLWPVLITGPLSRGGTNAARRASVVRGRVDRSSARALAERLNARQHAGSVGVATVV